MARAVIDRAFGREAFGADPAGYEAARPPYPDWLFELLCERCGLRPGQAVFEIGVGTGIATRRLLAMGARPLVAIEPDLRLANYLKESAPGAEVVAATFEEAPLAEGVFDLGACATAFHWLDEAAALAKIARALRPGGWWAVWWNAFFAEGLPDPFHDATERLLSSAPKSLSNGHDGRPPFAFDVEARIGAIDAAGAFEDARQDVRVWKIELTADETVALYSTYSDMNARAPDDRRRVLAELRRIAAEDFAGRVIRNVTTVIYTARRTAERPTP
jgi:SAM-dependent methyltransferase